jgi:hypothetical protein
MTWSFSANGLAELELISAIVNSTYPTWSIPALIENRIHFVESVFSTYRRNPLFADVLDETVASAAEMSAPFASVLDT